MIVVGIDPGVSGAVSVIQDGDLVDTFDMPIVDGNVSEILFITGLREIGFAIGHPDVCVIEKVSSMPGQGVSSTFKFGTAYGIQRCGPVALDWPTVFFTPAKWKGALGLGPDKEQARQRALQLWPTRCDWFKLKRHHGRAEAALLAHWWWRENHA